MPNHLRGKRWLFLQINVVAMAVCLNAATGTSALCEEAFAAGTDHVQLAVVDGNDAAQRLYESLGFKPFGRVRTILFT